MILVSGGCSFSCFNYTWPFHLAEKLNYIHHPTGWVSSGNQFISRRVIHKVMDLLNSNVDASTILVGIMWSGPDRFEVYTEDPVVYDVLSVPRISEKGLCVWPDHDKKGKWVIMNSYFENKLAKEYYKTFYNETQSMVQTLENVLRTQWFLEKHNINYFMTSYTSEVFNFENINKSQINHLQESIDWRKFLPIDGCYEWVRDNSANPFLHPPDRHPSRAQHIDFVDNLVIPILVERGYAKVS